MFDELGTRQERLSIGLPVWLTAVAMTYAGVPWLVVVPLGIVGLVLVAGSLTSTAQGATLAQLAVAAPLVAGHFAFAMPQEPWTMPRLSPPAAVAPVTPTLPEEIAEAPRGPYAACAHWAVVQAVALDCPSCGPAAKDASTRVSELSGFADARKCERIFLQTLAHWRGRTGDCETLAREHPRVAGEVGAAGKFCAAGSPSKG